MAEYIEKEALYRKIAELEECVRNLYLNSAPNTPERTIYNARMNELTIMKFMVADFPAADVAPVAHGRWEKGCVCSNCTMHSGPRNETSAIYYRYCPFCGAKMDLEE